MGITTSPNDPTQNALMEEFDTYLGAIAKGFAGNVQAAMQQAESDILTRIGNYHRDLATSQREGAERVAAQHRLVEKELQGFASMVQQLQNGMEASRKNFETAILKDLKDTVHRENEDLRAELNSLRQDFRASVVSGRNRALFTAVTGVLSLLISTAVLWNVWR